MLYNLYRINANGTSSLVSITEGLGGRQALTDYAKTIKGRTYINEGETFFVVPTSAINPGNTQCLFKWTRGRVAELPPLAAHNATLAD